MAPHDEHHRPSSHPARASEGDQRPWGFSEVLADQTNHRVKRITVYPGKRLSLERHRRRSEHWHVIEGRPLVTVDGQELTLHPGGSIDIHCGAPHRVHNPGDGRVVLIEVQRGEYFGEDDSERLEDDLGLG
jgi:mannose-6-phosphate isomerase